MPHDPKIEVFKIGLKRKDGAGTVSFREFFRTKANHYNDVNPKPASNFEILSIHMDNFIKSIGKEKYKTDSRKKKAFTVGVIEDETQIATQIEISSDQMFIDGFFIGGRFNAERILGKINDTSEKSKINRDNVVSDTFYFLLYTPLDHLEGVFIIQGYSESKISDIVKRHLKEYFSYYREWSSSVEPFLPLKYRQAFMKEAKFQKVVFSSSWDISDHDYEEITQRKQHKVQVRIEIIDQNVNKPEKGSIRNIVRWFGGSLFKMKNEQVKSLEEFEYKDAKMESRGQSVSIDLDNDEEEDDDKIKPTIRLTGEEYLNPNYSPNFPKIQEFCRNLLVEIVEEISPLNGVQEA
jgi:hypothetical protein